MRKWVMCVLVILLANIASGMPSLKLNYTVDHLEGQRWQYFYSIQNISYTEGLSGFIIGFEYGKYSNLASETPVQLIADWDEFISEPAYINEDFGHFDGFYDVLALSDPLLPGESVSGFSVSFDFQSDGEPGVQSFQIYDPVTWQTVFTGTTDIPQVGVIPAPGAFCLTAIGAGLTAAFRKR